MVPLYSPAGKSFSDLLQKKSWSRTQIKSHTWKFYYAYSYILRQHQMHQTEYVRVCMSDLDALFSNTVVQGVSVRLSTLVVDYLIGWNLIIRRRHNSDFETEEGDKRYKTEVFVKVLEETRALGWTRWDAAAPVPGVCLLPKPAPAAAMVIKKNTLTGIYAKLATQLPNIRIDAAAAREFTEKAYAEKMPLPAKRREITNEDGTKRYVVDRDRFVNDEVRSSWLSWIDAIEAGDYGGTQDTQGTGRFFNRITSSPKLLRQFLSWNGQPLVEADISNSQPLIFCTYLAQRFGADMPKNVRDFITECENGTFYATVRRLVLTPQQDEELTQQDFKVVFFAKIFYSTEKREWAWRKKFATRYPDVSEYITEMKQAGYKDLPRALSRKESEILLHGVSAKLLAAGAAFVTLHDAIYSTAEWMPLVQRLIRKEFTHQGVGVTIKQPATLPVAAPAAAPTPPACALTVEQKLAQLEADFAAAEASLESQQTYELLEAGAASVSNDDFFA